MLTPTAILSVYWAIGATVLSLGLIAGGDHGSEDGWDFLFRAGAGLLLIAAWPLTLATVFALGCGRVVRRSIDDAN